jgi:hypothetical protein
MKLVWKNFSLCKDGNREEENEDAVFPQLLNGSTLNVNHFSCAMSDGATTSSFSKLWANLLVKESSLSHDLQKDFNQTINSARAIWKGELAQKNLPWPAAIKVRQGSFATLLWFHIWHKDGTATSMSIPANYGWIAYAVGDTCLFYVMKGRFSTSFPLTRSDQFSNTPDLVSTNLAYYRFNSSNNSLSGTWQKGDHFLIASDALAAWFIQGLESNSITWQMVSENLTSLVRYQTWIRSLRRQALIKNDDTSLISLSVED